MDGGVRRGSDIIKAIALGAQAVGIGRPTLYGMASYGQDGAERVLQILKDEMVMGMRLCGAPTIKDITRDMVLTKSLASHIVPVPRDHLAESVYEPLGQSKL
jgi:L-lactate dehydrogenase (cytochrome)